MPAQCWAGGDRREQAHTVASTTKLASKSGETKQEHCLWFGGGRGSSARPWILSGRTQHTPTGRVGGAWGSAPDGHRWRVRNNTGTSRYSWSSTGWSSVYLEHMWPSSQWPVISGMSEHAGRGGGRWEGDLLGEMPLT